MNTFTMLIGIPGSGKSTYAIRHLNDNTIWLSSDNFREILYGDISDQIHNKEIFSYMNEMAIEGLENEYDIIYDATNISAARRRSLLSKLPECYKKCVVMLTPQEICIKRDAKRDYSVGEKVINKMIDRFQEPSYEEGWDDIEDFRYDESDEYMLGE